MESLRFLKSRAFFITAVLLVALSAPEILYFESVFERETAPLTLYDVVLVYGGKFSRTPAGLTMAQNAGVPIFISEAFGDAKDALEKAGAVTVPVTVDHFAKTTDQNARNAAKFLKAGGFRHPLLVTSWYHLPRALFLTRLYLAGSGITVEGRASDLIPPHWWQEPDAWAELAKFWGSVGRAALALFGFEKAWFHS